MYQTWPSDVEQDEDIIPETVSKFLQTVLTGKTDYSQPLETELNNSPTAVTGGKTKLPTHIVLAFAVKCLTGNIDLMRTMDGLDCSVSYTQIAEIDTALGLQKLEESHQTGVALPRNIYQGVFITLAWDNIDSSEETISGEVTSHRVNCMAVQSRIRGPMPQHNMK